MRYSNFVFSRLICQQWRWQLNVVNFCLVISRFNVCACIYISQFMCKIYSYVYLVIESRRETSDFVVRLSIMSLHRWARRSDFREKERDCENVSCKFSLLWCNTGPDTTGPPRDLCVRELDKILLRFVQVSFFFYRTDKLIYRFVRGKSISGLDSIKSKVYT